MSDVNGTYFEGKTWLIYGRLLNIAKGDSTAAITGRGGQIVKAVSGKLDFLVMPGPTPAPNAIRGAKAQRAAAVGAMVIGEPDFLRLIEGEDPFAPGSQPELSPLPDALAALTYPGEDVDLDATYFAGKSWFGYGDLRHENGYIVARDGLARRLGQRGAALTRDIEDADFIAHEGETPLWGARLSEDVQAARDRGVPIFGTKDFIGFLFRGERPRSPEDTHDPTVNEEFGELRAMVQADDWSSDTWRSYQKLLDGMGDEALEPAIEYLGGYLDRLPRARRLEAIAGAPNGWLGRAMAGHDDPRLRAARAAYVWGNAATKQFEAMFACENLGRIEKYSIGTSRPAAQRHWQLLAENETMKSLTCLRAHTQKFGVKAAEQLTASEPLSRLSVIDIDRCAFDAGAAATLFAPGTWPELTLLAIQRNRGDSDPLSAALVGRGLEGIERLKADAIWASNEFQTLLSHPTLSRLRTLELDDCAQESLDAARLGPAFDGLTTLDVSWQAHEARDMSFLRDERLGGLTRLRVTLGAGDGELLEWLSKDAEMASSLVTLELTSKAMDWTRWLRHAKMSNLRFLTLNMPGEDPFPLDEVFPALERVTYVEGFHKYDVEYGDERE